MRLALQARKLVDDSRGLLETVDEYKNTLTGAAIPPPLYPPPPSHSSLNVSRSTRH